MVSVYGIIEAVLLFVNALVILNEKRLLVHYGLANQNDVGFGVQDPNQGVKAKIATTLGAMRLVLMGPLIFVNITIVVLLLLFG